MSRELTAREVPRASYSHLALAQDAENLYWSTCSGDVLATPKAGGGTRFILAAQGCNATGLAVAGSHVYALRTCGGTTRSELELWSVEKTGKNPKLIQQGDGFIVQ